MTEVISGPSCYPQGDSKRTTHPAVGAKTCARRPERALQKAAQQAKEWGRMGLLTLLRPPSFPPRLAPEVSAMPPEEFDRYLHPFTPFRLQLSTGETFDVRHPDLIMVGKRALILGISNDPTPHYDRA